MVQVPQTTVAPPPAAPTPPAGRPARSARRGALALAALLAAVLVVNLAYLAVHGVAVGGDTGRYVDGLDLLLQGDERSGRIVLYFGYVVFAGVIQHAGGLSAVVVAQILLTVAATAAVFALARRLGGTWAGAIAAVLFGLNPELIRWNLYVLPEATYVAWLPISAWLVERAARERRGTAWAAIAVVVLAALRPHGRIPALLLASYLIVH